MPGELQEAPDAVVSSRRSNDARRRREKEIRLQRRSEPCDKAIEKIKFSLNDSKAAHNECMDMDENKSYEVPECEDCPRYGGPLGEDDDSEAKRKAEEREMKKQNWQEKGEKGFLTPERKKKLRVTLQTAYDESSGRSETATITKRAGKAKVLSQRTIPLPDVDTIEDHGKLEAIYNQLFQHMVKLEEEKYDINQAVMAKDAEINELTIAVNDLRGKFVKPTLKKYRNMITSKQMAKKTDKPEWSKKVVIKVALKRRKEAKAPVEEATRREDVADDEGENNNNKPYYGVPLGALHYSDGSTRAEVYAANEYTIIFHHFTHRPRQLGCTSMIIGPAQTTDRNTVNGGVFLSISQPMVASQPTTKKIYSTSAFYHFWHARMLTLIIHKDGKEPILSQQKDPFAGIEIDMKSSENITPKTKDIHIEEIGSPKIIDSSTVSTTNSNPIFASISITQNDDFSSESMNELTPFDTNAINIFDDSEIFVKIRDDVKQSNFTMESNITNADTTTIATNTKEFTSDSIKSTRSESKNFHVDVEFGDGDRVKTAMHVNEISKRLLPVSEENEHDTRNKQEGKVGNKINDAMKIDDSSEKFADDVFSETEKPNKFGRKDKGFPVMLGQPKPGKWFKKSLQQPNVEKLIKDSDKSATDDYILSEKVFETDEGEVFVSTQNAAATMTPLYRESTPLYWNKHENNLDHKAELRRKVYIDRRFELPLIEDKTVVFSLTNNAKITEYQWIALRDDCAQRTIPLLSLKGIDPPHEEEIGAFWILNCNTIFIPGFIFDQGNDPQGTYFHAGIGHFPDRIEKQVRAYVVGQPHDQPLRNYKGENVMIRLPKTYRTFDIDFISVFNEIEGYSYGHVITPCLLVPPCNDYDAI
ncbi:hypothetical protein DINM_022041 [Dirofilaria immitis]|nr:hypothetical protein [Dirofilaria immitis]